MELPLRTVFERPSLMEFAAGVRTELPHGAVVREDHGIDRIDALLGELEMEDL